MSKTTSTLVKQLMAALATGIVAPVEILLQKPAQERAETDWMRLVLGSLGVVCAVLLFQMAPKPPKEEEELPKEEPEEQQPADATQEDADASRVFEVTTTKKE